MDIHCFSVFILSALFQAASAYTTLRELKPELRLRRESLLSSASIKTRGGIQRWKINAFSWDITVFLSQIAHETCSSSSRCLLQTVTISLHCCPITSCFLRLALYFANQRRRKCLKNYFTRLSAKIYWHFIFFPRSAQHIRWADIVSSCCERVFYPGAMNYCATVPGCFDDVMFLYYGWMDGNLLHSSLERPTLLLLWLKFVSILDSVFCCWSGWKFVFYPKCCRRMLEHIRHSFVLCIYWFKRIYFILIFF